MCVNSTHLYTGQTTCADSGAWGEAGLDLRVGEMTAQKVLEVCQQNCLADDQCNFLLHQRTRNRCRLYSTCNKTRQTPVGWGGYTFSLEEVPRPAYDEEQCLSVPPALPPPPPPLTAPPHPAEPPAPPSAPLSFGVDVSLLLQTQDLLISELVIETIQLDTADVAGMSLSDLTAAALESAGTPDADLELAQTDDLLVTAGEGEDLPAEALLADLQALLGGGGGAISVAGLEELFIDPDESGASGQAAAYEQPPQCPLTFSPANASLAPGLSPRRALWIP